MNVKLFYEEIGGDYSEALSRLINDALIEKFLLKFKDGNYINNIEMYVKNKDYENLFMSAHTLKGVALNLSLKKLGASVSVLTDYVRGKNKNIAVQDEVEKLYSIVRRDYDAVIDALNWELI